MDVSKLHLDGEWIEIEAESERIGKLRFKLKPLSTDEQIDLAEVGTKNVKNFFKKINNLIIDWNLTDGDKPVPCTEENKRKYMPHLIPLRVKTGADKEEGPEMSILGVKLIEFAQNIENFIKN